MPNKSKIYAVVLIILTLVSMLTISSLALASTPRFSEVDAPAISNGIGKQVILQVDHLAGSDNNIFLPLVAKNLKPLYAPTLVAPGDGRATSSVMPTFQWNPSSNVTLYHIQVDDNADFSSPELNETLPGLDYTPTTVLGEVTYFWRVRAGYGVLWSPWSSVWSVTVNTAGSPVPNGDFESKPTIWIESSTNNRNLILHENSLPVVPHSGSWAAWLGGDLNETSIISQTLTVPVGYPYFTYWHWIDSEEVEYGFDFGGVAIYEEGDPYPDIYVYDLCLDNNTFGWRAYSVDLSDYAGMTRSIEIWTEETNGEFPSNLYVDEVSFKAYPATSSLIKTRKIEK